MNNKLLITNLYEVLAGAHDARFADVLSQIHCMSRARVYAVLNAVVSSMEPGELYVEVGTYQGGSLISALLGNTAHAIGVDSFEEFTATNNYSITQTNLESFGVADRAELINMGFADFFNHLPRETKIQVYYYDGAHGYEVQIAGMEAAWNFLAKDAIIMVDDYTYPEVMRAVNKFISNHQNEIKPLLIIDPIESTDPTWWNGCVILRRV